MTRKITSHIVNPTNDTIQIFVIDDPGVGGANHMYDIRAPGSESQRPNADVFKQRCWFLNFQDGGIAEVGVNGITHEVMLAILIDRLQGFQSGPFACRENAIALTKLEEAKMWLQKRTLERMARGVEGKVTA